MYEDRGTRPSQRGNSGLRSDIAVPEKSFGSKILLMLIGSRRWRTTLTRRVTGAASWVAPFSKAHPGSTCMAMLDGFLDKIAWSMRRGGCADVIVQGALPE